MNAWNIYVLGKLLLQWLGYIRIDPVPELACYVLVFALSRRTTWSGRQVAVLTAALSLLAAGLLWRESFLPPPEEALRYIVDPALRPSKTYFMRFLYGLFRPWQILAAGSIAAVFFALGSRKALDLTPLAAGLLLLSTVAWRGPDRQRLSAEADGFFSEEAARRVELPVPRSDFDVVLIHVCSLSWSDLRKVGLERHPFLSQFDVVFSSFNTVSSYSEQSSLRLGRALCGQPRNDSLYEEARPECYMADALRASGYRLDTAMNHGGEYLKMSEKIAKWGHLDAPMSLAGFPVAKVNFNGSSIYDDYRGLERWWKSRQKGGAARAALYYNTVSLHTGAYPAGQKGAWEEAPAKRYRMSATELFDSLGRFFGLLEASGRSVVVLLVPEHGAAIAGNQYLVPGMRDLPLPELTLVPVGVKFIGPRPKRDSPDGVSGPRVVSKPASYLALGQLLARLMSQPWSIDSLKNIQADLPATRYVAENKRMVLVADQKGLYLRWMDKKWVKLPDKFHPDRVRTW